MKLTDINIKKAKSGDKSRKIFDGGGLYIQVEPTGGKLWRYKYRFDGKEKKLTLGKYPDVSLQEARKRHGKAREQLAKGIDPSAIKKAQKQAGVERAANSFELVAREWFETWKTDKAESHYSKVIARLEKDVFPCRRRKGGGRRVKLHQNTEIIRGLFDRTAKANAPRLSRSDAFPPPPLPPIDRMTRLFVAPLFMFSVLFIYYSFV